MTLWKLYIQKRYSTKNKRVLKPNRVAVDQFLGRTKSSMYERRSLEEVKFKDSCVCSDATRKVYPVSRRICCGGVPGYKSDGNLVLG